MAQLAMYRKQTDELTTRLGMSQEQKSNFAQQVHLFVHACRLFGLDKRFLSESFALLLETAG